MLDVHQSKIQVSFDQLEVFDTTEKDPNTKYVNFDVKGEVRKLLVSRASTVAGIIDELKVLISWDVCGLSLEGAALNPSDDFYDFCWYSAERCPIHVMMKGDVNVMYYCARRGELHKNVLPVSADETVKTFIERVRSRLNEKEIGSLWIDGSLADENDKIVALYDGKSIWDMRVKEELKGNE